MLVGVKTARERFAGAVDTLTCEAMMATARRCSAPPASRAGPELRAGVRHDVHRRRRGAPAPSWMTSWGCSTRMVGALIMGHGDDDGPSSRPGWPRSR
ncbi:hypothetical protein HBB16_19075 [Pseudonocardia sp. MCCB 268]|nr:hypothetical protein [Pseudonocardia cytotoxica]